ncbi:MAG: phospho-sugar mutase, partial [Myxococcota bacterium]
MDPRIKAWLVRDPDEKTRSELEALVDTGQRDEIERRFESRLAFGTAGLRGLLGAGPSRMNRLVVRETTAGLAAYLLDTLPNAATMGVVVGFDGRHKSHVFAEDTACVLAARGIRVHLFERDIPTPVCAFAVAHLGAAAAIVITASHNPPAYNGYKVYWHNGAQIIPPHDSGIAAAIDRAARLDIPWCEPAEARGRGLIKTVGADLIEAYLSAIGDLSIHESKAGRGDLRIAYTPLHGVGARVAEVALRRAGFTNAQTAASQRDPDPDFPTVSFPNPEEPGAMDEVIALARKTEAALAVANDPDADRFAVAARTVDGDYQMLSGDDVGILLGANFIAKAPPRSVVATTIVSSRLLGIMARARGVGYYETLTGFKWIAAGGFAREAKGDRFLFGYEEALGYT